MANQTDQTNKTDATTLLYLGARQAAIVREATARLLPGPDEGGTGPGARQAGVVSYIDGLLGAFAVEPPRIYLAPGGSEFLPLSPAQRAGWRHRVDRLQETYHRGIAELDRLAAGDFAAAPDAVRDAALAAPSVAGFRDLLFDHAIEGVYGNPAYRGESGRPCASNAPGPESVTDWEPVLRLAAVFGEAVHRVVQGGCDD